MKTNKNGPTTVKQLHYGWTRPRDAPPPPDVTFQVWDDLGLEARRAPSGGRFWGGDVHDLLEHGQDSVEVGALPEHLPTSGAHVEERDPGQQPGGHGVELEGSPPGKGHCVGVQI